MRTRQPAAGTIAPTVATVTGAAIGVRVVIGTVAEIVDVVVIEVAAEVVTTAARVRATGPWCPSKTSSKKGCRARNAGYLNDEALGIPGASVAFERLDFNPRE
jgi:hypothetical protein